MKREIVCQGRCADFWRGMIGKYPGEYVTVVDGVLDVHCRCDSCDDNLRPGRKVSCVTVRREGELYMPHEWEKGYLLEVKT